MTTNAARICSLAAAAIALTACANQTADADSGSAQASTIQAVVTTTDPEPTVEEHTIETLEPLPPVRWGRQRWRSKWAFHRTHSKKSECAIAVNPILDTDAIAPETLKFLLYHELLHHILGNSHKHRPNFREYEHRFEGYQRADAELDSFADRYKVNFSNPKR